MEVNALSIIRHERTQRSLLFSFWGFPEIHTARGETTTCLVSVFSDTSSVCVFILGFFRKMNIFVYKDFVDAFLVLPLN